MSKQKLLLINRRQSRGKLIKLIVEEHMEKYNLSKSTISRINQGKKYKQLNIQYPIRSSANRVYN